MIIKNPKLLFLFSIFLYFVNSWDYQQQGRDWSGTCSINNGEQSPIDLFHDDRIANYVHGKVEVQNVNLTVSNYDDGHVISIKPVSGKFITMSIQDDQRTQYDSYTCTNFHFHAPSEHTIDGVQYEMEMHIGCSMDDPNGSGRNHAVLSFLFQEDDDAEEIPIMKEIVSHFNKKGYYPMNFATDFYRILKDTVETNFYYYKGSNTKPGCEEKYNWYVANNPIKIKADEIKPFQDKYINNEFDKTQGQGNNRFIQNLTKRFVYRGVYKIAKSQHYNLALTFKFSVGLFLIMLITIYK